MKKLLIILSCVFLSFSDDSDVVYKVTWYGSEFHGRKTASGEIFNKNKYTCAATTKYRLGDRLELTNVKNGNSVVVKVNDRGNFERHGIHLDLSEGAFKQLAPIKRGVISVTIKKLN